jgi:glycosyltransferase involved in cell wall biosynthesis
VVLLTALDSGFEAVRRCRHRGDQFRLLVVNHGNLPEHAAALLQHRELIDRAVCVSALSYSAIAGYPGGFAPERLRHIPNAVAVPAAQRQRNPHPPRIGSVGRLATEKRAGDIAPFFRALHERLPAAQLWVAGHGEHSPAMLALEHAFPDCFRYFGELDRGALERDFYPAIDLLVHFSPSEAWSLTIAEAMSFGVVPVTSAFRGLAAYGPVIEGENALVFPIGDVTQAAEMAVRLCEDHGLRNRLSSAAEARIRHGFSLNDFGESWSRTLDECLRLPALPAPRRPASLDARGPLGLPWPLWERCRRALRRRVPHASLGEEWPHFRCTDVQLLSRMAAAYAAHDGERP